MKNRLEYCVRFFAKCRSCSWGVLVTDHAGSVLAAKVAKQVVKTREKAISLKYERHLPMRFLRAVHSHRLKHCLGVLSAGIAFLFATGNASHAAIIVSYQGGSISSGGIGFVDVKVSSDAVPGSDDVLDSFSGHFQISPIGLAVPNGLQFVSPQNDSQLGMGNYVFAGNSLTPPPIGVVSTNVNTNDKYIGGDATLNGLGVLLNNTSDFLLFRLDLDAALTSLGDQYTISLVNDGSTAFLDTGFTPLNIHASSFNSFTITAVPEPATGGILLCGALVGAWIRKRRASRKLA